MSVYYYPFNFLTSAVTVDGPTPPTDKTYLELTGLTSGLETDAPMPDFPADREYIDDTLIMGMPNVGVERRVTKTHRLKRRWILRYSAITDEQEIQIRQFYATIVRGRRDSFFFVDPEEWTFGSGYPITDEAEYLTTKVDQIARVRFDSGYKFQRFNKNFYTGELTFVEVFE